MVVLPDGRILTGGTCAHDYILMRFNPNGSFDTGFDGDPENPGGGDGVVETKFPQKVFADTITVDPGSGAITLSGGCCTNALPAGQDTSSPVTAPTVGSTPAMTARSSIPPGETARS